MAFAFVLLMSLLAFYGSERFAESLSFGHPEVQITLQFWESEPNRKERTESKLIKALPARSHYRVYEAFDETDIHFSQTIVVHVEYNSALGLIHVFQLQDVLWKALIQGRGGISYEIVRFQGPEPLVFAFWLQIAMMPWLLIRFWIMPRDCPPAKPLAPRANQTKRLIAACIFSGLILGVLIPLAFGAASALGILTFSDQMPDLETFGVDPDLLWGASMLFALVGAIEEVFFRGVLLRRFVQNGLPRFGVFLCAFWFTLLHVSYFSWYSGNVAYALWIGVIGLGLGALTLRTRTWVPAAVAHGSYNFTVTQVAGWSLL